MQHAFKEGLVGSQHKIRLIDKTGKCYDFNSKAKASLFLNRSSGYLWERLKQGKQTAFSKNEVKYKVVNYDTRRTTQ